MRENKKQCTSQHEQASPSSVRRRGLPQQCLPAVRVYVKASSLRKHTQPVYRSVVIRGQNRRTQVDVSAAVATRESRTSGDANKQVLCTSIRPSTAVPCVAPGNSDILPEITGRSGTCRNKQIKPRACCVERFTWSLFLSLSQPPAPPAPPLKPPPGDYLLLATTHAELRVSKTRNKCYRPC